MKVLTDINIRPIRHDDPPRDVPQLDALRAAFKLSGDGVVDLPFGYSAVGVEAAIADKNDRIVGAAIAEKSVLIHFVKDPTADPVDIAAGAYCLERALTYVAQQNGCVASYVAVPSHMTDWIKVVKHGGYTETFPNCTIFRRPLAKERVSPTSSADSAH